MKEKLINHESIVYENHFLLEQLRNNSAKRIKSEIRDFELLTKDEFKENAFEKIFIVTIAVSKHLNSPYHTLLFKSVQGLTNSYYYLKFLNKKYLFI